MEISVFNILVLIAFGLMAVVSGGVVYLTIAEWRDRRRRDQERRGDRAASGGVEKASRSSSRSAEKSSHSANKTKKANKTKD